MSLADGGYALVLVFCGDRRESVLVHAHDGGLPYLGNVIKRGIQYARTHYDGGNIVDVLLSEPEMQRVGDALVEPTARTKDVRHLYYLTHLWDFKKGIRRYRLLYYHRTEPFGSGFSFLPEDADHIPKEAETLF